MKYILSAVVFFFATGVFAQPIEFKHFDWQDIMEKRMGLWCRKSTTDCGVFIRDTPDLKTIKWNKWGVEVFRRNKDGVYELVPSDAMDKDEKIALEIESEYGQLEYTFKNPYVKLNPYTRAPLSALIKFPTKQPAEVTLTIFGIKPAEDIVHTFKGFKTQHEIPVIGLYANHQNQIKLTARYQTGKTEETNISIQTGRISNEMLYQILSKKDDRNLYYFTFGGYIYDEYGYVRYFFNGPNMKYIYHNELVTESRSGGVTRYTLLGKKIKHYPYPKGFTSFEHGMDVMPNGNFLVIGSWEGEEAKIDGIMQPTQRDFVLEIDRETGRVNHQWDLAQVLNPDRTVIVKSSARDFGKIDWCHINSVHYDEADRSLVISCRHTGMLKIDYQTGDLKWVFGPRVGYDKSGRDGTGAAIWHKVLVAEDANGKAFPDSVQKGLESVETFKWPTKTHDAKSIGNGLYSILDNSGQVFDPNIYTTQDSVASIFKVDADKKTVQQVWLKRLGEYSIVGSSVTYLPKDNEVIVSLTEVRDKNTTLAFSKIERYDFDTQEKLFEASVYKGGWTYRAEPVTFYPTK